MSDAFLERLTLAEVLPCLAEPTKCVIVGRPSRPLTEVLPYVNAILPNILSYNPTAGIMTLRRQPGFITLYPDKVYITQVRDSSEGLDLLEALRQVINKIWDRRAQITPAVTGRQPPGFLDIWKLLPRRNCKRCGQPTCLAFAVALLQAKAQSADCPFLCEENLAGQRDALEALLWQSEV